MCEFLWLFWMYMLSQCSYWIFPLIQKAPLCLLPMVHWDYESAYQYYTQYFSILSYTLSHKINHIVYLIPFLYSFVVFGLIHTVDLSVLYIEEWSIQTFEFTSKVFVSSLSQIFFSFLSYLEIDIVGLWNVPPRRMYLRLISQVGAIGKCWKLLRDEA